MIGGKIRVCFLICLLFVAGLLVGQNKSDTLQKNDIFIITKNDGAVFIGKIISENAKEVLILTNKTGEVSIPKHEIKSIVKAKPNELTGEGELVNAEVFATRYFITTNAIPINKGESYILWNLYGPDFQYGLAKNLGIGIMTSWVGMPVIGTLKYSHSINKHLHVGAGLLGGTGSWALPEWGLLLPYGLITFGNKTHNINFSAGYGAVFEKSNSDGRFLLSIAGLTKIGKKISLVFDSFIMPPGEYYTSEEINFNPLSGKDETSMVRKRREGFGLFIPGIRWQLEPNKAFQFGFAGLNINGEMIAVPIPMIQWFRKL